MTLSAEQVAERMCFVRNDERFALWNASAIIHAAHAAHGGQPEQAVDEAFEIADRVDELLADSPRVTQEMAEMERAIGRLTPASSNPKTQEPLNE